MSHYIHLADKKKKKRKRSAVNESPEKKGTHSAQKFKESATSSMFIVYANNLILSDTNRTKKSRYIIFSNRQINFCYSL